MILFENRDIATIIAALRYWQQMEEEPNEWLLDIATDGGSELLMDAEDIDILIEEKLQEFRRM